jgi:hypothetical protein
VDDVVSLVEPVEALPVTIRTITSALATSQGVPLAIPPPSREPPRQPRWRRVAATIPTAACTPRGANPNATATSGPPMPTALIPTSATSRAPERRRSYGMAAQERSGAASSHGTPADGRCRGPAGAALASLASLFPFNHAADASRRLRAASHGSMVVDLALWRAACIIGGDERHHACTGERSRSREHLGPGQRSLGHGGPASDARSCVVRID